MRAGTHSPFNQTPSPDPNGTDDIILPAVTKRPSPPITSPPPLLKVPQRQNSGGKRKNLSRSSFKDKQTSSAMQPSFPHSVSSKRKPSLHLPLSPFTNEGLSIRNKDPPQIKSPRSLPTETFKFLRKAPPSMNTPKGSQILRSSGKYKLPPNFSSSSDKSKNSDVGGGITLTTPRPTDLRLNENKSRPQFNSPSVKIASFNKIKLPIAHKGLGNEPVVKSAFLNY